MELGSPEALKGVVSTGLGFAIVSRAVAAKEKQLGEFNASLPMTYVLRDDYIRNQSILEAKLDNVAEKLTEIYKMESQKK